MSASQFFGSWQLVSWKIPGPDGVPHFPLGPDAKGLLVYAPDGYMFAALMAVGRPNFLGSDPLGGTADEAKNAMRGYHTYCGRYRLEETRVVHMVDMCLCPNLLGTKQIRYYRFEGDQLVLTTPPLTRAGVKGIAELIWQRAPDVSA